MIKRVYSCQIGASFRFAGGKSLPNVIAYYYVLEGEGKEGWKREREREHRKEISPVDSKLIIDDVVSTVLLGERDNIDAPRHVARLSGDLT